MAMRCRVCGIENADGSPACRQCGSPLVVGPSQPPSQSGPPPVAHNPFSDSATQRPVPNYYQPPTAQSPYPYPYPPPSSPPDPSLKMLIPIGRSGYAIAAGYLGLLSIAFCFLAPFSILFGILAILDIKKNPTKVGMPRAIVGIVGGAIGMIWLVMVLVAIATKR